jgi:hypothetical protein
MRESVQTGEKGRARGSFFSPRPARRATVRGTPHYKTPHYKQTVRRTQGAASFVFLVPRSKVTYERRSSGIFLGNASRLVMMKPSPLARSFMCSASEFLSVVIETCFILIFMQVKAY